MSNIIRAPAAIWANCWPGIQSCESRLEIKDKYPIWSGTVSTAGDLVFFGTMDGWFKAADAKTGKILWQIKLDSGISASL